MNDRLTANENVELDTLVEQVEKLDIGISKDAAKSMGVNSLKAVLAKSGFAVVNSGGGFIKQNDNKDGCTSLELPTSAKEK